MLALLPARTPETVMVTLGLTVQLFTVSVPRVIAPVTELFPVAFRCSVDGEKLADTFKAPVSEVVPTPHILGLPAKFSVPVPAFAVKALML